MGLRGWARPCGVKRTQIRRLLGQIWSFPLRVFGGISLKVSPSFSYALIRGWVHAKTPASLGHRAGRWEEARRWLCRRWCRLLLVATVPFGMTATGSLAGKELWSGDGSVRSSRLIQSLISICFQGNATWKWTQLLFEVFCMSMSSKAMLLRLSKPKNMALGKRSWLLWMVMVQNGLHVQPEKSLAKHCPVLYPLSLLYLQGWGCWHIFPLQ